MSNTPSDEELIAELEAAGVAFMAFRGGAGLTKKIWTTSGSQDAKKIATGIRAVLEKWGTPQPVVREPLTDAQIAEMMRDTWGCASIAPRHALEFARAVERAHGITPIPPAPRQASAHRLR